MAARSRCSRSPIVSLSPRSLSRWRLRHCSSSQALNASHVGNCGIGTMKLRRA
jgi:DTW domain-containing protein YfiP